MTLAGLSPVQTVARASGLRPNFCDEIGADRADDLAGGRRAAAVCCARPGAVALSASWFQFFLRMSIRFMPAPSPKSIGAILPASSEAMNELTSAMCAVLA